MCPCQPPCCRHPCCCCQETAWSSLRCACRGCLDCCSRDPCCWRYCGACWSRCCCGCCCWVACRGPSGGRPCCRPRCPCVCCGCCCCVCCCCCGRCCCCCGCCCGCCCCGCCGGPWGRCCWAGGGPPFCSCPPFRPSVLRRSSFCRSSCACAGPNAPQSRSTAAALVARMNCIAYTLLSTTTTSGCLAGTASGSGTIAKRGALSVGLSVVP